MLRQKGLHGWIVFAAAAPLSAPRAESLKPAATHLVATTIATSPLVFLCTDMLLTKLTTPNPQEIR